MGEINNIDYLLKQINSKQFKAIDIPFDPDKIFFVSDLHFFHKNIMDFCHRPFKDLDEMNETLINNWNNVVKDDCIVFDLGDFAFASTGKWNQLLDKLNGFHILIKGNHDAGRAPQKSAMERFLAVSNELFIKIGDQKIYLNHKPYLCFDGTYRTSNIPWQLFGHVHLNSNKEYNIGRDFERLKLLFPNQYDVGVDFNSYTPISYLEVKEKIEYQIQNNVNCLHWIK